MSKKCPFNRFEPCIGKDCAFFLDPIKSKGFFDDTVVGENIVDPSALIFPYSILVTGMQAFFTAEDRFKQMKK